MSYKIEKIPDKERYPFKDMKLNDSFLIECDESEFAKHRQQLWYDQRKHPIKISTKKEDKGLRVIRIK